ncbi:MAG: hypothetical protein Fur0018_02460 [Anaerolineales bacterium]
MTEILRFLAIFQGWVYGLVMVLGLNFLYRFLRAWDELRRSAFGLERRMAQMRINQAASALVLLVLLGVFEFVLVNFWVPATPGAMPLPTTIAPLLTTPTVTLPPELAGTPLPQETPAPSSAAPSETAACVPDQVEILFPDQDATVAGLITLRGSASIPNFGFFKLEYAAGNENTWLAVLAKDSPVVAGELGQWDTSRLVPGLYRLRLVVTDNQGAAQQPCVVRVNVIPPTPSP